MYDDVGSNVLNCDNVWKPSDKVDYAGYEGFIGVLNYVGRTIILYDDLCGRFSFRLSKIMCKLYHGPYVF